MTTALHAFAAFASICRSALPRLLVVFCAGLWLTGHQTLTDRDYHYADCGAEAGAAGKLCRRIAPCGSTPMAFWPTGWPGCR